MGGRLSDGAPSECDSKDEEHQEDEEENFRDIGCDACDPAEAEHTGNDRNYEKDNCPVKHSTLRSIGFLKLGIAAKVTSDALSIRTTEQSVCPQTEVID